MTTDATDQPFLDPLVLLKGLVSLRRLTGMYPPGHPWIEQKLSELDDVVQKHLRDAPALRIDVTGCPVYHERLDRRYARRAGAQAAADWRRHVRLVV